MHEVPDPAACSRCRRRQYWRPRRRCSLPAGGCGASMQPQALGQMPAAIWAPPRWACGRTTPPGSLRTSRTGPTPASRRCWAAVCASEQRTDAQPHCRHHVRVVQDMHNSTWGMLRCAVHMKAVRCSAGHCKSAADCILAKHEQEMVDEAAAARRKCQGSGMRVVVQNGTVWVDHLSPRPPKGWYPATLGPGGVQRTYALGTTR